MVAFRQPLRIDMAPDDKPGKIQHPFARPPQANEKFVVLASKVVGREAADSVEHVAANRQIGGQQAAGVGRARLKWLRAVIENRKWRPMFPIEPRRYGTRPMRQNLSTNRRYIRMSI